MTLRGGKSNVWFGCFPGFDDTPNVPLKYTELSKVRVASDEFGIWEGFVVATLFRNGRWIYKVSIPDENDKNALRQLDPRGIG